MPRFFFDVCAADLLIVDEVGEVMDGPEAALLAATHLLPIVYRSACFPTQGDFPDVSVRDHSGRVIAVAALSLAVCRFDQPDADILASTLAPAPAVLRTSPSQPAHVVTEVARSRTLIAESFVLQTQVHSELMDASRHMRGIRTLLEQLVPSSW